MREMKDSGIEWVGETPKKWEIIKNKYLITMLYSGGTPSATNEKFYCQENGTPFVSISDMSNCSYVTTTKKHITELGIQDKKLQIMPKGTILYSIYATVGAISELRIEAAISQAILAIKVNSKILKSFYKYNLEAMRDYIFSNASGNTQFNLNAEKVRNFYFVHPPLSEQQKISTYLDTKCTKIDSIIEKQEKVIEKLKEYKLSKINEIVTDVDGVCCHLGHISLMKNGLNFNLSPNGNKVKFLGVGDFKDYFVLNDKSMFSDIIIDDEIPDDYLLQNGDIIFVRSNGSKDLVGRAVMVENIDYKLTYSGFCIKFRNTRDDLINDKYLLYFFRSPYFRKQLEKYSQGSNISNINQVLLSQISIIIPSLSYQNTALKKLDKLSLCIDSAIEKKQAIIEKLKEYKKSLIYEVVTGKKEV